MIYHLVGTHWLAPTLQVIIYHPTQVPPDTIMEKLSSMTSKHQILSSAKAAFAGLML
jgi:hypothetical protein